MKKINLITYLVFFLLTGLIILSGCNEAVHDFGFDGQLAIRELLMMTPSMQQLLMRPSHELSTELIEKTAVKDGMLTMQQDGVLRVLKGDTTYDEISRVIG